MVKLILETLKMGQNFITPEGNIIFSTQLEIEEWNRMNKINLRKISRRYNKLFEEFVQYIIDRKEPNNSNETKVYKALTKNPTRTNPERDAKGNVDYGKMGNGSGDNKKKKGSRNKNKDNSSDEDDFDEKLEVIKDILVLHNIKNTFTLYNYLRTPMRMIKMMMKMKMMMINLV